MKLWHCTYIHKYILTIQPESLAGIKFGGLPEISVIKLLADLNLAVQYGIMIPIYIYIYIYIIYMGVRKMY